MRHNSVRSFSLARSATPDGAILRYCSETDCASIRRQIGSFTPTRQEPRPAAFENDAARGHESEDMRVRLLLRLKHASGERGDRVVVKHGHRLLPNDRPAVVFVVDEM